MYLNGGKKVMTARAKSQIFPSLDSSFSEKKENKNKPHPT
jgi:hypothetical protein